MKQYNLLITAHPDDETIFFSGLLQTYRRRPWKIVCVTDGNADGAGEKRKVDFLNACAKLKVKTAEMWGLPDRFERRLSLEDLRLRLAAETPAEIFTHGILGEYGHPHHQDVSLAVHRAYGKSSIPLWSVAYNCFAEKVIRMPQRAFQTKCAILAQTYFSETHRFNRFLPAYNHEGYARVKLAEVERLYAFFIGTAPAPTPAELDTYRWFEPYLAGFKAQVAERAF